MTWSPTAQKPKLSEAKDFVRTGRLYGDLWRLARLILSRQFNLALAQRRNLLGGGA